MTSNPEKNFLPDFCSLKMLLVVFFLAELLAILLTLASHKIEMGFLSEFALRSLWLLWVCLSSTAALCSLKKILQNQSNTLIAWVAFFTIQSISLLVCWLIIDVLPASDLIMEFIETENKVNFYARTMGITTLISLAFLRYLYVLFQWKLQMQAKAEAQLNALQARMRPHFLFNSLNSIASLTRINPELAETLVEDLAELIRASMKIDDAVLVPMKEEINLVKLYLTIEEQRLDARLQVEWQIENLPKDALIPALSLQPLVENAVHYGIEPYAEGGKIIITGRVFMKRIFISISNPKAPPSYRRRVSNHIALENLNARIQGCFQGDGILKTQVDKKHHQVSLEIPYQKPKIA